MTRWDSVQFIKCLLSPYWKPGSVQGTTKDVKERNDKGAERNWEKKGEEEVRKGVELAI